ncbi:hypothetical protein EVAR_94505_1 [Eumeta japonica]|uniref:Uncharacterized protein n=1 Tax=Eumeta variegata TaxID=151549 RepID=A0A4C1UW00_EUMVA|nr:hypothetical protein EVAR_94505_1 [Eumeta japonica]
MYPARPRRPAAADGRPRLSATTGARAPPTALITDYVHEYNIYCDKRVLFYRGHAIDIGVGPRPERAGGAGRGWCLLNARNSCDCCIVCELRNPKWGSSGGERPSLGEAASSAIEIFEFSQNDNRCND